MPEMASVAKFHVSTDEHNGKAVTFDYSSKDASSLVDSKHLVSSPVNASANGNAVVGAKIDTQGSPGNVLVDGAPALSVGVTHWRFIGVPNCKGGFGCGVSNATGFGSGWKLRGFYLTSNGNIAGRGALKCGFVQHMPQHPVVDWIIEVASDNVTVDFYLYVNDELKGHAGHLTFPNAEAVSALRPMITFDDSSEDCQVVFVSHDTVPASDNAPYKHVAVPVTPFDARWRLVSPALTAPEHGITLSLSAQGLSAKVINSMRVGGGVNLDDGSIAVSGPVASTMMMPMPPFQDSEKQISHMLEKATHWSWERQATLTLTSDGNKFTFEIDRDQPVTENPLLPESN
eukprot:Gregarina_sp_Pseudo_9__1121@NODE_1732_length_1363_cov_663_182024_g1606_i0_p1_GENE_NODE_1732_length_1363_cov_663_182024_g1606_i0NODE_1732_length_1363_cov_663_182024_g1606_i0_p1_ORF_typecomplete_len344_score90_79META/PF03724_16/2_1e09_NODE_1732_length_1363_cov_663_182024_g1606_i02151246